MRFSTVAFAGLAYFTVVLLALHALRPDIDPVAQPTSQYANGPYGFLMTTAFLSMSAATWALVFGLLRRAPRQLFARAGIALLALWGAGVLVAMVFPIDPEGARRTLAGMIHSINGPLAFLSVTGGTLLLSRSFKKDARWQPIHPVAWTLAFVLLAMFAATIVSRGVGLGIAGLIQRASLVALVAWMAIATARLRAVAGGDAR